jgi:ATP-dependent Lon protease
VSVARSYLRSMATEFGIAEDAFEQADLHIHVPSGAIPKDGPSAGVTMATAMVSALRNQTVREDVAMTGEITLTGQVLPIGGLKEKALAAQRYGIRTVVAPALNEADAEDVPDHLRRRLRFVWVREAADALETALEPPRDRARADGYARP